MMIYGTAGFRDRAEKLPDVAYRMGLLATLRAAVKKAKIGIMITASHNPEQDNGIKLIDPDGEMLDALWEPLATRLANIDDAALNPVFKEIASDVGISASDHLKLLPSCSGESDAIVVFVGRDTRKSSPELSALLQKGISDAGGRFIDYGVLTTPQLHFLVRIANNNNNCDSSADLPSLSNYYDTLISAFNMLNSSYEQSHSNSAYTNKLYIDAANGVGSKAVQFIKDQLKDIIELELFNDGTDHLNELCGADYVKVQQKPPTVNNGPKDFAIKPGMRLASFDGDADRIVYYFIDNDGSFHLLDGDKIAVLITSFLQDLLDEAGLRSSLKLGVVQTAYANGSSTQYIESVLNVPVACVPTGVKHLHRKAAEFDIGIYFEANGHGTVLFGNNFHRIISDTASRYNCDDQRSMALNKLSHLPKLINQAIGDALSDLLTVETILRHRNWSIADWNAMYDELPCRQLKVKVNDRSVIKTADAERRAIEPAGLQEKIDALVKEVTNGRAFVRPSGTEDVVRVYAEAKTRDETEALAIRVARAVYDMAGGNGERP